MGFWEYRLKKYEAELAHQKEMLQLNAEIQLKVLQEKYALREKVLTSGGISALIRYLTY